MIQERGEKTYPRSKMSEAINFCKECKSMTVFRNKHVALCKKCEVAKKEALRHINKKIEKTGPRLWGT